jgi:small subunit ribosomal protein S17
MAETQPTAPAAERRIRKTLIGVVTSDKMQKTVVVTVTHRIRHPMYKKYIRRRMKYKAHDERSEAKVGDRVLLVETRPLSREKRWAVQKVLEKAV